MSLVLAVAVLAVWIGRAWQRTLRAAAQQARALEAGRFIQTPEPRWPELRDLTRSLNATVARLREVYAAQAERVTRLQRQAQLDAVTGVSVRQPFMGQLQHQLAEPGGPGSALLLLRLLQLEALNLRLGHEPTDRLLRGVGDILLTYVDRVPGTFAGRLKGSDFALCLPVPGVALETAESLRAALSASPALRMGGAELAIGGVDGLVDTTVSAALAAADAALARAEAGARVVVDPHGAREAEAVGARAWREQIASALSEGRTRLAEFSVVDRTGQLIHLECPLRVQMRPGGEFDTAERWLALARRSRLLPQADLTALQLALKAIAEDGRPRAVRVALSSLAAEGFVAAASWRLQAAPTAAQRLSIECVEGLRPAQLGRLADAATAWRRWGVRLGIEHGGAAAQALPRLREAGIDYVKVDARHVRGAATDAAVRDYAQSLVALIHGLGLTALADGVDDAADLAALWPLGFDGVTGSAVTTL
jgi:EAL domain-containing protein (putative c-di-GMP-specific phosphodiesterase class I)